MGKTVVRYCDICKREIEVEGFRIKIKRGKRFYLGLINGIDSVDICDDCISVISDIVNHKISSDNLVQTSSDTIRQTSVISYKRKSMNQT